MNLIDQFICEIDTGLRIIFAPTYAERPTPMPAANLIVGPIAPTMGAEERREAARLMRVNHTGEVCAQALYQGQALTAKSAETRQLLMQASLEERDHLAWCETRLERLGGATSVLNPLFYAGAFGLGVVSGMLGDKWSMGFLVETERQVEAHLSDHLNRLPEADDASRAVLEAMQADEIRHGQAGVDHGAVELPAPLRGAMRAFSRVMTGTSYWV